MLNKTFPTSLKGFRTSRRSDHGRHFHKSLSFHLVLERVLRRYGHLVQGVVKITLVLFITLLIPIHNYLSIVLLLIIIFVIGRSNHRPVDEIPGDIASRITKKVQKKVKKSTKQKKMY